MKFFDWATRARRLVAAFAVVALFAVVLPMDAAATGIEESAASAPSVPLQILYPKSVSSIPFLILIDQFPNEYRGDFFTDHPQALAQLLNGDIDVLATGFTVGYSRFSSAGDLVYISTPVWGVSALMTAQPITVLDELSGGTIYAPFEGSPIDIYLKKILEEAGLSDQVEIAYAPFPQATALLAQGKAEAAVLVEPLASRLELAGQANRFENLHDGWARIANGEKRSPQVTLYATADRMRTIGPATRHLAARLTEAVGEVTADPEMYAERYADALGFPAPVIARAIANTLFAVPPDNTQEDIVRAYLNLIGAPLPGEDFFAGE